MDIALILMRRFDDKQWEYDGGGYSDLRWYSDEPKPSESDLEALWPGVEYENLYEKVEKARQAAYVTQSDPLFFEWQRGDATEQEWRDAVQAVKTAHPYPTPLGQ